MSLSLASAGYRTTVKFFLLNQEHLAGFVRDPKHYAVLETNRQRANTRRNDFSIALKSYLRERWDDDRISISHDAAYRLDAEFVFVVKATHGNFYVCLKTRGTTEKSMAVGVRIDGATTHDAKKLDLFEAVCLCLQQEVISEPVCFLGIPTPWHYSIAQQRNLEIMHDEGDSSFRVF